MTLNVRSQTVGYAAALAIPVGVTYSVAWLGWPPFIFEHLVVLLVVVIALPYGVGPAIVAAATSVVADNVLLREPIGRPTITGYRDVLDLLLFAAVAVVISELVRRVSVRSNHDVAVDSVPGAAVVRTTVFARAFALEQMRHTRWLPWPSPSENRR